MSKWTLVDGRSEDRIPVDDRGFLFGDHLFETCLSNGEAVPLWALHWDRFTRGASILGFDLPEEETFLDDIRALSDGQVAIFRLSVSRGSSQCGYWIPADLLPRRVVQKRLWPDTICRQRGQGMVVGTADIKLQSSDILAGLKHGNRIMQVLLSKECQVKGFDELIVFREDGSLVEAIASNILVVLDEKLVTPAKPDVAGVGLQWVKSQQIPLEFCRLSLNELRKASEILLINSVAGVRPVRRWEDQTFEVGEMCHRLQNLWNQMLP